MDKSKQSEKSMEIAADKANDELKSEVLVMDINVDINDDTKFEGLYLDSWA